jgi:hypothetical protein
MKRGEGIPGMGNRLSHKEGLVDPAAPSPRLASPRLSPRPALALPFPSITATPRPWYLLLASNHPAVAALSLVSALILHLQAFLSLAPPIDRAPTDFWPLLLRLC